LNAECNNDKELTTLKDEFGGFHSNQVQKIVNRAGKLNEYWALKAVILIKKS